MTLLKTGKGRNIGEGNRLKEYDGIEYTHDPLGNLIYRELPNGEKQYFQYDTENQLTRAEIKKPQGNTEIWEYAYDPFGRRLSKERKDKLAWVSTAPKRTHFVWDGSRLLQEYTYKGNYTYLYTDQDSYEPLAQVFYNRKDDKQYLSYYHTDQIGIPREMTDQFGNLLWFGEYTAWGCLKDEKRIYQNAHQPFRLQNQYFDAETGLHYNFFRYYEPDTGRFVNQDPVGLMGGDNLYQFAPNGQIWIDPLGLEKFNLGQGYTGRVDLYPIKNGTSFEIHVFNPQKQEVGMYGPDGWFNKHGHRGRPEGIPDSVDNACRGKAVEVGRRIGVVPPKGTANIKGGRLRNFFAKLIPGLSAVAVAVEPSPKRACSGAFRIPNEDTCRDLGE